MRTVAILLIALAIYLWWRAYSSQAAPAVSGDAQAAAIPAAPGVPAKGRPKAPTRPPTTTHRVRGRQPVHQIRTHRATGPFGVPVVLPDAPLIAPE
jgi:hypothetical protein